MNEPHSSAATGGTATATARWKPLARIDRRVAGVLIEKAKTTPEQYPMTINGLINGCNQKSNRDPQMQLEEGDISESLDRLKAAGAVVEIQGSGRVAKYRHLLYEWLGVDKVELAVMAELLLRGAQSEGELRGRAARMEPIADLTALRAVLDSLRSKRLVIDLTPPGRGQILTHGMYEPEEMERLKAKFAFSGGSYEDHAAPASTYADRPHSRSVTPPPIHSHAASAASSTVSTSAASSSAATSRLSEELQTLRAELAELRREVESLSDTVHKQDQTIADLRSSLGG